MQNKANERPWWAVIVLLVILFPVGVVMLIYKVLHDKRQRMKNGRVMLTIGAVSAIMGLMGFGLMTVSGADDPMTALAVFGIPAAVLVLFGIVMLSWGGTWYRKGCRYVRYARFLLLSSERSITAIAKSMGVNTMQALETLEDMIMLDYLRGFYVDYGQLMLMSKENAQYALRCRHCGGTSILTVGKPAVCAYCGAAL